MEIEGRERGGRFRRVWGLYRAKVHGRGKGGIRTVPGYARGLKTWLGGMSEKYGTCRFIWKTKGERGE